jgi:hypothetical protein
VVQVAVQPVRVHWVKVQAMLYLGKSENSAGFMDYFAGDNQLVFKIT